MIANSQLLEILHRLVDNLEPLLDQLNANTVPTLKVSLDEHGGRKLILSAGIEFEQPRTQTAVPAELTNTEPHTVNSRILD